jgi:large subunit ribosomal protein L25
MIFTRLLILVFFGIIVRKAYMEEIVLEAKRRDVLGKQVNALRRGGTLPGIIYGPHISPIPISLEYHQVSRILPTITSSHLVVIDVDGDKHTTLVRDKQRHPVLGTLQHIDFMAVSMTERLRANVHIELHGEAPAADEFGGILVTGQEEVEVECLPSDLPEKLILDISGLLQIGDALHIKDIVVPANVQILTNLDEMVVLVTAPAAEEVEEVEEVEGEEEEAEPEVIEKGKKEEENEEE